MRIALYGGSFDPPHAGHVQCVRYLLESALADRVIVVPNGHAPYREQFAPAQDRYQMSLRAFGDIPGAQVSDIEITRPGPCYTADTLEELDRLLPGNEWYVVVGSDKLATLPRWKGLDRILRLARFMAVGRGDTLSDMPPGFPVIPVDWSGPDLSSTDIRAQRLAGGPVPCSVPEKAARYITESGLYLSALSPDGIRAELQKRLKPSRLAHTEGVCRTSLSLAGRYGVDTGKALIAALLHDCAKYIPPETQRQYAAQLPDCDEQELAAPAVLHAPAGCVSAQRDFGVRDSDILNAIRNHTLGRSGMSTLEKLIFVSDFIEDGRADFPGLSEARALAEKDLSAAAVRCALLTDQYLVRNGQKPHPRTLKWIKEETLNGEQGTGACDT